MIALYKGRVTSVGRRDRSQFRSRNVVADQKHRVDILGIEIDNLSSSELLQRVDDFIADGNPHQIVYINIDTANRSVKDPSYRRIVKSADLVYADGMGVVLASRLFSTPLKERVNAGDFLPDMCARAAEKGHRIYLLGGEEGVAEKVKQNLTERYPNLCIVGAQSGYFPDERSESVVREIHEARPDILLVGMGSPKQEKWIHRNLERLGVPVAWGVGALFDYYSGRIRRAPIWMREWGLEWMHRLTKEPRRLWQRYLVGNVVFSLRIALFVLTDMLSAAFAWFGAYYFARLYREWLQPTSLNPIDSYIEAIPLIIVLWVAICAYSGLYRRRRNLSPFEELRSVVITTLAYTVCASAVAFLLFKQQDLGRSVVLVSAAFNFFLLVLTRWAYRHTHGHLIREEPERHRTLIVGAGPTGAAIRSRMENHPFVDHRIVGFVDDRLEKGSEVDGLPVLGGMGDILGLIDEHEVDEVFFANPDASSHDVLDLISAYRSRPVEQDVTFKVASEDMFQFIATRVSLEEVDNFPVVELNVRETSAFYDFVKRLIDVVLALFLGAAVLPLFPLIIVAIKMESPGPAVFRHKRVGKDGKPFIMYKFRTMHRNVNEYEEAPIQPEDPRIIPLIGSLLRRTSLDELPQLWNVLKGEMSMVGPRPEMPFLVDRYQPWQKMRLSVKPGITGLWQIIGRKDLPLYANLEYDFYYIQNQSVMLDLLILLKTIPSVLFGKGAF